MWTQNFGENHMKLKSFDIKLQTLQNSILKCFCISKSVASNIYNQIEIQPT